MFRASPGVSTTRRLLLVARGNLRQQQHRQQKAVLQQRLLSYIPAVATGSPSLSKSFQRQHDHYFRQQRFFASAEATATASQEAAKITSTPCQENLVKEAIKKMMLERHHEQNHDEEKSKTITDDELEQRFRSFEVCNVGVLLSYPAA